MVFRRRLIERTYGQGDVTVYDGVWGFRVCGLCAGDYIEVYGYDGALAQRIEVEADGCMEVDIPEDPEPLSFYDDVWAYVVHKGYMRPEDLCHVSPKYYVADVPQTSYTLEKAYYYVYDSAGNYAGALPGETQLAVPHIFIEPANLYYEAEIYGPPPDCPLRMILQIPLEDQAKFAAGGKTGTNRWAVVKVAAQNGAEKGNIRVWAGTLILHRL